MEQWQSVNQVVPHIRQVHAYRCGATSYTSSLGLAGRWLHKAGFTIGSMVRVDVTPGRLVIESIPEFTEHPPHLPRRAQKLFF
jgi:hypothetical protein